MYNIDSMYESMADGVVDSLKQKKASRWAVAAAIWLGRQQILSAPQFWYQTAGKMLAELSGPDADALRGQLTKAEDALFDGFTNDWPAIPDGLKTYIDQWSPAPVEVDLDALRAEAVVKIDRAAEAYRMQFITPGFGQIMAYQQKLDEARAKVAFAGVPDADIPHIVAEAEADGMTKAEKAQQILDTFTGWQHISAGVEAKRMAAKKAIAAAETAQAITAAAEVNWSAE
ncbi:hypothetical protein [Rhizobium sp. 9140]|uniref:hypothetical protein n=1 Tax=Rhizobium sp. 9140 TaxID=1761900 RepID=UPI000795C2B4|nr:hypothetical protein [Rhizobium sp. 9140]CZT32985.1 hypothetical protein GA0004734_00000130 [Rhizobium sp. 9140]